MHRWTMFACIYTPRGVQGFPELSPKLTEQSSNGRRSVCQIHLLFRLQLSENYFPPQPQLQKPGFVLRSR